MPAVKIQGDYDQLAQAVQKFAQEADQTRQLLQQVQRVVGQLQSGDWIGVGADRFFSEMQDLVFPGMQRLGEVLQDASQATQRISQTFQQAEQEAGRLFQGDGSGSSAGGDGSGAGVFGEPDSKKGPGVSVNIADYKNGENGWNVIPGANSPYVSQGTNPRCLYYAPVNAAIAAGYSATQSQADTIANSHPKPNPNWRSDQLKVLDNLGATYEHKNFKESWGHGFLGLQSGTNKQAAEQWLIQNVQAGRPVVVNTNTDNTFGLPNQAHTYTVVGVKTDTNGRLTSVLVSTNWGSTPFNEIPAGSFMTDWSNHSNADGIAVNRKPSN